MKRIDTTNTRPGRCVSHPPLGMMVLATPSKAAPTLPRPPRPPTGGKNKIPKEVNFNPNVGIKSFEATKDDLQRAWYSKADFKNFADHAMADAIIVRRLLKKKDKRRPLTFHEQLVLDATPIRGIEQFISSSKNVHARLQQQSNVIMAVLTEQQRQRISNVIEADIIALASLDHSFVARGRAAELGKIDTIEAEAVHKT